MRIREFSCTRHPAHQRYRSKMAEFAKPPTRGSLKSRIDAVGITDGVMVQLEEGATLQTIVDLCADHGITTTPASVLALKRSHLPDWQAQRLMADAAADGIPAQCLPDAVRGILLAKIGRFAVSCATLDQLRSINSTFSDWQRAAVAERAEIRQERDPVRRFAMRIDDLLENADKLDAVRRARADASGSGTEARLLAIIANVWGDAF
jgi:hypothetical protein